MISVEEARRRVIAASPRLPAEPVDLKHAVGRVLAAPVVASRDQPPFAASAMDGYAFAAPSAPRTFQIVGESAAGNAFPRALAAGEAVRISTGAPLPIGADTVLAQEDARIEGASLVDVHAPKGRHVRPRAGDFAAGATLLEAGRRIDPISLALAASAGLTTLSVAKRLRVTVFAGGEEVVPPGAPVRDDQVFESGSYAVRALIESWGGAANAGAVLPDQQSAIEKAAAAALADADLLVLIGGASVGPHDHARAAIATLGLEIQFDKISVRPGKPTWLAKAPRGMVLGLPGNPASAIVCALLFLRPLVDTMLGAPVTAALATQSAPLAQSIAANGARESYLRAHLDQSGALTAFDDQDSSLLSVFSRANALIRRPTNAPACKAGDAVDYIDLRLA